MTAGVDFYGALGGDYHFQRFTLGYDKYFLLKEDLTDRKTTLGLHGNLGYITGDSVFFERFYGGGIGSVRGFQFRGISPRAGIEDDPIGGDFLATGSVEVSFPLIGENLRGVLFADVGTVEEEFEFGKIRSSVGPGIRLILPFLGQAPLAVDFGIPITKGDEDETQIISFTFGFSQ
jgi:outer membrane protein insertion porin family